MRGTAAYLYSSIVPMANRGVELPSNNTDPDNQYLTCRTIAKLTTLRRHNADLKKYLFLSLI